MAAEAAGPKPRGHPPFGFTRKGGRFVEDPETASTLRRILALLDDGMPQLAIARLLNQEGVPSPNGRQWHAPAIHRVRLRRR